MTAPAALPPSPSRKWLVNGIAVFLLVVCIVLLVRQVTGNTQREHRLAVQREKEARELSSKEPGNAETFSARLEARRRNIEEEDRLKQIRDTAAGTAAPPATRAALPTAPVPEASMPAGTMPTGGGRAALPVGAPPALTQDEQLAAHELMKEQVQRDQGRRMGAWEPTRSAEMRLGSNDELLQRAAAIAASTGPTAGAGENTSATLLSAYLRAQQGAVAPAPDREARFLQQVATDTQRSRSVLRAEQGPGRFALLEGTPIEVAMLTEVVSDLPGNCRAQVTRPVYDTVTGRELLIPAGSRLTCVFNAEVVQGQSRLMLAFPRLIFPNGSSVALGAMQGADMAGASGAPAEVNGHFWKIFGASMAVAMVTHFAERESTGGVTINVSGSAAGTAAGVLADVAKRSLDRNINIKPELRLAAGERLIVVVSRDLVLDPAVTGTNR